MENHELVLSEYLLAAPSASAISKLAEECNLSSTETLCFLTSSSSEESAVFKKVRTSESEVFDLSKFEGITRIIVSPTAEEALAYGKERYWVRTSWEGLIMPQLSEVQEYQKVYPDYTSTE